MKIDYVEVIKCPVDSCDSEEFQTSLGPRSLMGPSICPDGEYYRSSYIFNLIRCVKCKKVFQLSYAFEFQDNVPEEVWEEKK